MRRKKKSENNGFNVWRSYSDMMAGVLLLFVLIMCVTLFQAQKSYNESLQERDEKIALQEEYTQELLDKQNALDEKDETLQNQDAQLKTQDEKLAEQEQQLAALAAKLKEQGAKEWAQAEKKCTAVGIGRKDRAVKRSAGADRPDHRCEGRRN